MGTRGRKRRVRLLGDDDDRVDVHGIPVWPVEVEDAIRSDGRIGEVAVVRHDESLVAVVAFEPSTEADTRMTGKAFRAQLARRIPSHLLPSRIIVVDRLPRNADGGANSDALDRLIWAKSERSDHVAPRTDLERVLAGAWEEILGLENIGVNEEFIALGGDSCWRQEWSRDCGKNSTQTR